MTSKKIAFFCLIVLCDATVQAVPSLHRLKEAVVAAGYFGNKVVCDEKSFFSAIAEGDAVQVKQLLRQCPYLIHAKLPVKRGVHTPLSCAIYYDHPQVMTALLKADNRYLEEAIPLEGNPTPLIYALLLRRKEITKELLDRKAKVNYVLGSGDIQKTPLMWAICMRDIESVRLLLERGANPNLRNCYTSPMELIKELLCDETTRKTITGLLRQYGAAN